MHDVSEPAPTPLATLQDVFGLEAFRPLQEAIVESHQAGQIVPDEVEFLAGLQRIEYVFVDPDRRDIIIAGRCPPVATEANGSVNFVPQHWVSPWVDNGDPGPQAGDAHTRIRFRDECGRYVARTDAGAPLEN